MSTKNAQATEPTVHAVYEPEAATELPDGSAAEGESLPIEIEVRITALHPHGRIRARASLCLNNAFVIKNVRVIDGKKGLFVAMPGYRSPISGANMDYCYPVVPKFRGQIREAVFAAYQQALASGVQQASEIPGDNGAES